MSALAMPVWMKATYTLLHLPRQGKGEAICGSWAWGGEALSQPPAKPVGPQVQSLGWGRTVIPAAGSRQ